jgi:hypothetical protein
MLHPGITRVKPLALTIRPAPTAQYWAPSMHLSSLISFPPRNHPVEHSQSSYHTSSETILRVSVPSPSGLRKGGAALRMQRYAGETEILINPLKKGTLHQLLSNSR